MISAEPNDLIAAPAFPWITTGHIRAIFTPQRFGTAPNAPASYFA